jgi:hypothetical protein
MSAWGVGVLDNDEALDFVEDLIHTPNKDRLKLIKSVLNEAQDFGQMEEALVGILVIGWLRGRVELDERTARKLKSMKELELPVELIDLSKEILVRISDKKSKWMRAWYRKYKDDAKKELEKLEKVLE